MNTLHIIGNGFDRAHNLPTSYKDFRDFIDEVGFLSKHKTILEEAFNQNGISLWSDFERCIGNIDLTTYADRVYNDYEENSFPGFLSINVYNWFVGQFSPSVKKLIETFKLWVWTLEEELDAMPRESQLSDIGFDFSGYFFTFNYTNTLEEVYEIQSDHICHLHGSATDDMSKIIVGHNTDFEEFQRSVECTLGFKACVSAPDVAKFLVDLMNLYIKPYKEIISKGNTFLKDIEFDKIVVMGCSLNEIDMPYFRWIAQKYPNAKWNICWYSDKDLQNAQGMDFIDSENKIYQKV